MTGALWQKRESERKQREEEARSKEAEARARKEAEEKARQEEAKQAAAAQVRKAAEENVKAVEQARLAAKAKALQDREKAERKRKQAEEAERRRKAAGPKVYTRWPFDQSEAQRRQQETADALGLPVDYEVDLGKGVKMGFVLIPAGEFMMGGDGEYDGKPIHKVRLSKPFYVGKYPVTQAQWQAVMGKNPSGFKGDQNPVERVSWDDCQEFLKRLATPTLRCTRYILV